jgi:hypothetical protein
MLHHFQLLQTNPRYRYFPTGMMMPQAIRPWMVLNGNLRDQLPHLFATIRIRYVMRREVVLQTNRAFSTRQNRHNRMSRWARRPQHISLLSRLSHMRPILQQACLLLGPMLLQLLRHELIGPSPSSITRGRKTRPRDDRPRGPNSRQPLQQSFFLRHLR